MVSIDVFGQQLRKSVIVRQGAPGLGFTLTIDGQYDMDNKRLCNVAYPKDSRDAASLESVYQIVQEAILSQNQETYSSIKENTFMIKALESKV